MNAELLNIWKNAAQKSDHSVRIYAEDLLAIIAGAERALLAAAPAPIQKEPEATHKRQVFMDEIDAAKAGSEWLEPFFGPGFRLSFSVDEGARAPQAKWCILFDSLDRVVAGYMLTRDAKNWTELTKVGPHATPPALAGSQVQAAGDVPWRVAEFWSSANPDKKCLMLAKDEQELSEWGKRSDFIRWCSPDPKAMLEQQHADQG